MATVHLVGVQQGRAPRADHADQRDEPRPDQRAGPLDDRHTGFGAWLRRARKARGLTHDDITRHTKIPPRHLEALEQGNLDILPAFYLRAEVRAFAREVGVNEQVALALLQAIATPVEPPHERPREAPREPAPQEHPAIYVALALNTVFVTGILTAALFVWMMAGRPITSEGAPRTGAGWRRAPSIWAQNDPSGTATIQRVSMAAVVGRSEDLPLRDSTADLVVTTQPAGARVTVNGIGWGMSPVTIRHLPAGDKRIRVSKDGYAAVERVLALDGGPRLALDIPLRPAPIR